jgi:secondary thiamine-phosphate synthase enzyme
MLRQTSAVLAIRASRAGLHEFTIRVRDFVAESRIREGLLTIFCRHTSTSLLIQENAASAARRDIEAYFTRIGHAIVHSDQRWPADAWHLAGHFPV